MTKPFRRKWLLGLACCLLAASQLAAEEMPPPPGAPKFAGFRPDPGPPGVERVKQIPPEEFAKYDQMRASERALREPSERNLRKELFGNEIVLAILERLGMLGILTLVVVGILLILFLLLTIADYLFPKRPLKGVDRVVDAEFVVLTSSRRDPGERTAGDTGSAVPVVGSKAQGAGQRGRSWFFYLGSAFGAAGKILNRPLTSSRRDPGQRTAGDTGSTVPVVGSEAQGAGQRGGSWFLYLGSDGKGGDHVPRLGGPVGTPKRDPRFVRHEAKGIIERANSNEVLHLTGRPILVSQC
jgi:hypothetical protein